MTSDPLQVREAALDDVREAAAIEAFVRASAGATPFHLPAWTRATAAAARQRGRYLVAERVGAIAGVLPLTEMRSPLFGSALVSSAFATDGGILADDDAAVAALARAAWDRAAAAGIGSVELRGGPVPGGDWRITDSAYIGFVRELGRSDEEELRIIPRNRRHTVRRSLKVGFDITTGADTRERAAHYRVFSESVRNLGTPVFPRALFDAVLDAFGEEADILTVWKDGVPMASVLNLYFDGTVFPYWGGSTLAGRDMLAADAMYFGVMRHARERGYRRYDFGRSKTGTGTAAYKAHWNFEPVPLRYAVKTAPGTAPRVVNPLSPKYRLQVAAWKKLPLWAANWMGPQLSRGLG